MSIHTTVSQKASLYQKASRYEQKQKQMMKKTFELHRDQRLLKGSLNSPFINLNSLNSVRLSTQARSNRIKSAKFNIRSMKKQKKKQDKQDDCPTIEFKQLKWIPIISAYDPKRLKNMTVKKQKFQQFFEMHNPNDDPLGKIYIPSVLRHFKQWKNKINRKYIRILDQFIYGRSIKNLQKIGLELKQIHEITVQMKEILTQVMDKYEHSKVRTLIQSYKQALQNTTQIYKVINIIYQSKVKIQKILSKLEDKHKLQQKLQNLRQSKLKQAKQLFVRPKIKQFQQLIISRVSEALQEITQITINALQKMENMRLIIQRTQNILIKSNDNLGFDTIVSINEIFSTILNQTRVFESFGKVIQQNDFFNQQFKNKAYQYKEQLETQKFLVIKFVLNIVKSITISMMETLYQYHSLNEPLKRQDQDFMIILKQFECIGDTLSKQNVKQSTTIIDFSKKIKSKLQQLTNHIKKLKQYRANKITEIDLIDFSHFIESLIPFSKEYKKNIKDLIKDFDELNQQILKNQVTSNKKIIPKKDLQIEYLERLKHLNIQLISKQYQQQYIFNEYTINIFDVVLVNKIKQQIGQFKQITLNYTKYLKKFDQYRKNNLLTILIGDIVLKSRFIQNVEFIEQLIINLQKIEEKNILTQFQSSKILYDKLYSILKNQKIKILFLKNVYVKLSKFAEPQKINESIIKIQESIKANKQYQQQLKFCIQKKQFLKLIHKKLIEHNNKQLSTQLQRVIQEYQHVQNIHLYQLKMSHAKYLIYPNGSIIIQISQLIFYQYIISNNKKSFINKKLRQKLKVLQIQKKKLDELKQVRIYKQINVLAEKNNQISKILHSFIFQLTQMIVQIQEGITAKQAIPKYIKFMNSAINYLNYRKQRYFCLISESNQPVYLSHFQNRFSQNIVYQFFESLGIKSSKQINKKIKQSWKKIEYDPNQIPKKPVIAINQLAEIKSQKQNKDEVKPQKKKKDKIKNNEIQQIEQDIIQQDDNKIQDLDQDIQQIKSNDQFDYQSNQQISRKNALQQQNMDQEIQENHSEQKMQQVYSENNQAVISQNQNEAIEENQQIQKNVNLIYQDMQDQQNNKYKQQFNEEQQNYEQEFEDNPNEQIVKTQKITTNKQRVNHLPPEEKLKLQQAKVLIIRLNQIKSLLFLVESINQIDSIFEPKYLKVSVYSDFLNSFYYLKYINDGNTNNPILEQKYKLMASNLDEIESNLNAKINNNVLKYYFNSTQKYKNIIKCIQSMRGKKNSVDINNIDKLNKFGHQLFQIYNFKVYNIITQQNEIIYFSVDDPIQNNTFINFVVGQITIQFAATQKQEIVKTYFKKINQTNYQIVNLKNFNFILNNKLIKSLQQYIEFSQYFQLYSTLHFQQLCINILDSIANKDPSKLKLAQSNFSQIMQIIKIANAEFITKHTTNYYNSILIFIQQLKQKIANKAKQIQNNQNKLNFQVDKITKVNDINQIAEKIISNQLIKGKKFIHFKYLNSTFFFKQQSQINNTIYYDKILEILHLKQFINNQNQVFNQIQKSIYQVNWNDVICKIIKEIHEIKDKKNRKKFLQTITENFINSTKIQNLGLVGQYQTSLKSLNVIKNNNIYEIFKIPQTNQILNQINSLITKKQKFLNFVKKTDSSIIRKDTYDLIVQQLQSVADQLRFKYILFYTKNKNLIIMFPCLDKDKCCDLFLKYVEDIYKVRLTSAQLSPPKEFQYRYQIALPPLKISFFYNGDMKQYQKYIKRVMIIQINNHKRTLYNGPIQNQIQLEYDCIEMLVFQVSLYENGVKRFRQTFEKVKQNQIIYSQVLENHIDKLISKQIQKQQQRIKMQNLLKKIQQQKIELERQRQLQKKQEEQRIQKQQLKKLEIQKKRQQKKKRNSQKKKLMKQKNQQKKIEQVVQPQQSPIDQLSPNKKQDKKQEQNASPVINQFNIQNQNIKNPIQNRQQLIQPPIQTANKDNIQVKANSIQFKANNIQVKANSIQVKDQSKVLDNKKSQIKNIQNPDQNQGVNNLNQTKQKI